MPRPIGDAHFSIEVQEGRNAQGRDRVIVLLHKDGTTHWLPLPPEQGHYLAARLEIASERVDARIQRSIDYLRRRIREERHRGN